MKLSKLPCLCLALAGQVCSQATQESLVNAISSYTELTSFRGVLDAFPGVIPTLLAGVTHGVTLLVPTNEAFADFLKQSNVTNLAQLNATQLQTVLQYHIMDAPLTATNFSVPKGITVPTRLRNAEFNLRTAGPAITQQFGEDATGQVLFVSQLPARSGKSKFRVVRDLNGAAAQLRGGLGQDGVLTAVDGKWDGGVFQAIDTILSPPLPCSNTARSFGETLKSLNNALNKTGLWPTLDSSANVTCLAPSSAAFKQAGSPEETLGNTELAGALMFHTLPLVTYSNFLENGTEIMSLANLTVRVTVRDGETYFNDAKVINANVLTNNGLLHILDRVMSPNGTAPAVGTPTSTPTSTSRPATTTPNVGHAVSGSGAGAGLFAFLAAAMLL